MADERRVIQLVLEAVGEEELKKMTRELVAVRGAAEKSQTSLDKMHGSVKSIGTLLKGEFIGRMVAQAFTAITNAAVDATKQMDEFAVAISKGDISKLDDDAKKLAKTLSGEALAGAHNLTQQVHDLQQAIAKASMEIMGGMAPALETIIESLTGASGKGIDFVEVGRKIGDVIVTITAVLAAGAAQVRSYGEAFAHLAKTLADVSAAKNFAAMGEFSLAAKAAGEALSEAGKVKSAINGIADARAAAAKKVTDAYAANIAAAKKAGAELDKIRRNGLIETAPGKAAKGGKGGKSTKEEAADTLDLAKANAALNASLEKLADARDKAAKAQADYVAGLERAADPTIAYGEGMLKLAEAQAHVGVTAEAARVETERLTEVRDAATKALVENSAAHKQLAAEQEAAAKKLEEFKQQWGFVGDAVEQATFDVITGAMKIGQAMKRLVSQILSEIARLMAARLAASIVGSLFGGSSVTAFGNKAISGMGSMPIRFAAGGVVGGPTMFANGGGIGIMGEAGPEAIMPLRRNASGQLGVIGAGAVNVVVNNNAPSAAISVRQSGDAVQIDVIERQLADRIRRGGSALPGAIENTYRSGRGAGAFG